MQVREHQREVLALHKRIDALQRQLAMSVRSAAHAKERGTWRVISAEKAASAATRTACVTRKDAEESLYEMSAHVRPHACMLTCCSWSKEST